MTDQPLETKAWDGRWLAVAFVKPTSTVGAHYMLYEVQRAANHYEAALLARDKWSLAADTHLMVVALSPEIVKAAEALSVEPVLPGPRWFLISSTGSSASTSLAQISEDAWLRQIRAEWSYKAPPPAPVAGEEAAVHGGADLSKAT